MIEEKLLSLFRTDSTSSIGSTFPCEHIGIFKGVQHLHINVYEHLKRHHLHIKIWKH